MEGDTLAAKIAPDATGRRDVRASAEIDIADAFAAMQCVAVTVGVRGRDVSEPPHAWQVVKVQLSYTDCFGDRVYRDASLPRGTFDRTNVTVRVSPLLAPLGIPGGRVSAIAWAPGADQYLRDCIGIFRDYGWDWTYHAFREWAGWSVEHEGEDDASLRPSADNPRKQALLEGMRGR